MTALRVVAMVVLAVLLGVRPAAAHTSLQGTDPADGARLDGPPAAVTLTFDEPVLTLGARVEVTGPDGSAASGAPQVEGATVSQPLRADAPPGAYTVTWRVVAGDGHPVTGRFGFRTDGAGATQPDPSTGGGLPPASTEAPRSGLAWIWLGGGLLALAGLVVGVALRDRPPSRR